MRKSIKKPVVTFLAATIIATSAVAAPLFTSVTIEAHSRVAITICDAPLRPQPYKSSGEIDIIPMYSSVTIYSEYVNSYGNTWYYVDYEDSEGWHCGGWVYEGNLLF